MAASLPYMSDGFQSGGDFGPRNPNLPLLAELFSFPLFVGKSPDA